MLEKLGKTIRKVTDRIANSIFLDKEEVQSIIKDLQRALIEADVDVFLVKELSDKIKKEAMNERIKGIEKKEHIIKLLHSSLIEILGGEKKELKLKRGQNRILLIGLYGSGKTTTASKLGNYFSKRGKKTVLVGLDVHRPAAKEQLKQMAKKAKTPFITDFEEKDPIKIWKKNKKEIEKYELVIIDSAGRHSLDKELIKEIKQISKETKPTEIILILPADIGQSAKSQTQEFQKAVNITGVIITRMDSSAKGGGAISACAETKAPIYFITTGEKINDIEEFDPDSFLSRLLGMGDLKTLIEKIKLITDEDKQEELKKRIEKGELKLEDVIEQVKSLNSLGGFSKLKSLIPGMGNLNIGDEKLEEQQERIKRWEYILTSMTKEEKENPELLEKQTTRISRIAKGSGTTTKDVRTLLKQYKLLKEMIKSQSMSSGELSQKQLKKLMKKFGRFKKII